MARIRPGGAIIDAVQYNSTAHPVPANAHHYWVYAEANAWVAVRNTNTVVPSLDESAVASPIAGGVLYGPIDLQQGVGQDLFFHVAGADGATKVVITVG